ncbi:MAG TPA: tripartite tricarboxylate transporter TctB family protein, partial [Alphaproteobacteria bacterium]|nr:tripartite tricarboxylate transporter TctB family protein [Alphaproteobacteria bacterium]
MSNSPLQAPEENPQGGGVAAAPRPWWLGIAVVALGGVCLYGTLDLPQGARYAAIGPGLFVTAVGIGLVVFGLLLLVQIARGERFVPQDAEDAAGAGKADPVALLTAFAAAVIPVVTMEPLGLPITAAISFTLVARSFGSRRIVMDVVAGAVLGAAA